MSLLKKTYQPKTFDVVFNGARGINQTIIFGQCEIELNVSFHLPNFIRRVQKGLFRKHKQCTPSTLLEKHISYKLITKLL